MVKLVIWDAIVPIMTLTEIISLAITTTSYNNDKNISSHAS